MTKGEILEGNKLIAEFMINHKHEVEYPTGLIGDWIFKGSDEELLQFIKKTKYHSEWDWLMPVYAKINQYILNRSLTDFVFATNTEQLHLNLWMALEDCSDTPLELWFHVVEYIKWHNQNKL